MIVILEIVTITVLDIKDAKINIDFSLNHKVIFDYLFKSSYMPV